MDGRRQAAQKSEFASHPNQKRQQTDREVCKFYGKTLKGCRKGNDCPFLHIKSSITTTTTTTSSTITTTTTESITYSGEEQPSQPSLVRHELRRDNVKDHSHHHSTQTQPTQQHHHRSERGGGGGGRVQGGGWGRGGGGGQRQGGGGGFSGGGVQYSLKPKTRPTRRGNTPERDSQSEGDEDEDYVLEHAFKHFVVHCRKSEFDVYIGRPNPTIESTFEWGNPFKIGKDGNRRQVIEKYEAWIRSDPTLCEKAKNELKGKVLACWCAPLPCHGDILATIANEDEVN